MLSVSFSLALVAAMLFGIVLPGHHTEVDKFNGQTHGLLPVGTSRLSDCDSKIQGCPKNPYNPNIEL